MIIFIKHHEVMRKPIMIDLPRKTNGDTVRRTDLA